MLFKLLVASDDSPPGKSLLFGVGDLMDTGE
jgi:hypothetical protein